MKRYSFVLLLAIIGGMGTAVGQIQEKSVRFQIGEDLLLAQFDCKTDVDDLHSVAAFVMLMAHPEYQNVDYHAVAGTYGTQSGLYVPANELFQMAFGDNWSDAHSNRYQALNEVATRVKTTLRKGGNIWIADAGQSDFSALLIQEIQNELPRINAKERFHIVQHSNWNEEVTTPELLSFVKEQATYHKIPDGNAVGNGTPGFRTPGYTAWRTQIQDTRLLAIWELAVSLGKAFNGKEGRYNNEAVAADGLDFSDVSETCYILGIESINDTEAFFKTYAQ